MRRVRLSLAAALVVGGLAMNAIGETTARADSVAGSQGTDTTLPATPSQQVVHGRGPSPISPSRSTRRPT